MVPPDEVLASIPAIFGKKSMKARILFVDDDRHFSEITKEYLEAKDFEVILRHDAESALAEFKKNDFDLCLLDVKMPITNGFKVAELIKDLNDRIPLVFLTGQHGKEDVLTGLELGADDYITKPFSMQVLFLRIKNILKRSDFENSRKELAENFSVGAFEFDAASRELSHAEKVKQLTAIEANLLKMFCENENRVIERDQVLKRIWADEDSIRGRSLNVYVSKLRKLLRADDRIEFLNVHGVGYKMVVRAH